MNRRDFLRTAALAAFGGLTFPARGQAADETGELYRSLVPADKRLDPEWVASLTRPGHPLDAPIRGSRADGTLRFIGMTAGGIACGTVYLGGDGRLWVWDIFNQRHEGVVAQQIDVPDGLENIAGAGRRIRERDGANYVNPPSPDTFPPPFRQGFGLQLGATFRTFEEAGWPDVGFDGRWPVGLVTYRDPDGPVEVSLHGFSPFIPLNTDDSSLPLTCMEFTVTNRSAAPVDAALHGWLENAVCPVTRRQTPVLLNTRRKTLGPVRVLVHEAGIAAPDTAARPDLVFADFEQAGYGTWTAEGEAFGRGPVSKAEVPAYQGDLNMADRRAVNSHAAAPGESVREKDEKTGTLTSPAFTIERNFIAFRIGGGAHKGRTCLNLLVDGKPVRSATGRDNNRMEPAAFAVADLAGRVARLQVVDAESGGWGNVGVDHVVFTDRPPAGPAKLEDAEDFGSMALACLDGTAEAADREGIPGWRVPLTLRPGERRTVVFLIAWHFPNLAPIGPLGRKRRHYAARFTDAAAVAEYAAMHYPRLAADTARWMETWYEGTLPRWLLDRAILTTNTLQTANSLRFEDGRFWAWEGIGCCPGTCAHVWHYAQGVARLFPDLERNLREVTDFGIAQDTDSGGVFFRAECNRGFAIDAQAGIVLRTWREHLCSADDGFLRRVWPGARKALEYLIAFDRTDGLLDGLLDGRQHNTLDAEWYGKVHCLCSLYLAALRAGEQMAEERGDDTFRAECRAIYEKGRGAIAQLFNGEFYVQAEDPKHRDAIGVGKGCYIDQVIGQFWAFQTGLGRLYDEGHIRSALNSLWRYNFLTDVGPFRKVFKRGRFYAMPGDGGLLMCTWPNGGLRDDFMKHWQYGYFNECMTGFEWQAAAHMVAEGTPDLVQKGLAIARTIHDRYAPAARNPYNEIECSDHYARAGASYGVYLAACGFEYHGPKGLLGFAPRIAPERFQCAFTAAEGWGLFAQQVDRRSLRASVHVRWGRLKLNELRLHWPDAPASFRSEVRLNGAAAPAAATLRDGAVCLRLEAGVALAADGRLEIALTT